MLYSQIVALLKRNTAKWGAITRDMLKEEIRRVKEDYQKNSYKN